MKERLMTSESVTYGHSDKFSDLVSNALMDEYLEGDSKSKVAIETTVFGNRITVGGEVTSKTKVDVVKVVQDLLEEVGYGYMIKDMEVEVLLREQSPEIFSGVVKEDGEIGAGDQGCLKYDSLVNTEKGLVKIKDVVIGDRVLTRKGYKEVVMAKKTGKKETIRLITDRGRKIELTPDHKVFTDDGWIEAQYTEGKKLLIDDTLKHKEGSVDLRSIIECVDLNKDYRSKNSVKENAYTFNEDWAYILGFLIGDGYIANDKYVQFTIKNSEKKDAIYQVLKRVVKEERIKEVELGLKVNCKLFREILYKLGLGYELSHTKRVPDSIFVSNDKIKGSFLRGLFDTDGSCVTFKTRETAQRDSVKLKVGSVSRDLLEGAMLLLKSLGIDCGIFEGGNGELGKYNKSGIKSNYKLYVLNVRGTDSLYKFKDTVGFSVSSKRNKFLEFMESFDGKRNYSNDETIVRIESGDVVDVYDLEVNECHEYFANGILVHNCMWGYASGNEFTNYMPYGAYLSHVLVDKLTEVRENGLLPYLRPDGKTQVTVIYDEDDRVVGVDSIVLSTMHTEEVSLEQLREDVDEYVITPVLEEHGEPINVGKHINTAGLFTLGFGLADAGLTGRKIVVDSYGGYAKHGGGNYNGKDASKVDRSGAYMARYLAKNILDDSKERFPELDIKDVEVQLGYAIGVIEPVSLLVNIYSHKNNERLSISDDYAQFIQDNISCTPKAIIDRFDLNNVKTKPLSVGGHFGKKGYKWEELDIEFKI